MEALSLSIVTFLAAALTFFSGFGPGTLLMPVFAVFFPIELAISLTAIVHLLNNVLRLFLVGRFMERDVVLKFGVPAILAAFLGVWVLGHLSELSPLAQYHLFGHVLSVTPVKLVIGLLLMIFTLLEMVGNERAVVFEQLFPHDRWHAEWILRRVVWASGGAEKCVPHSGGTV